MKLKKKFIIGGGVVLLGAALLISVVGGNSDNVGPYVQVGDAKGQNVKVEEAQKVDIQMKVSATGMLEADEKETLYAKSNVQVDQVLVSPGDVVKKGDVLVTFKPDTKEDIEKQLETVELQLVDAHLALKQLQNPGEVELKSAKSNLLTAEKTLEDVQLLEESTKITLEQAHRDLETAESNLNANKALYEEGLISKTELDGSQTALEGAQLAVKKAQVALDTTKKDKEKAQLSYEMAQYNLEDLKNTYPDSPRGTQMTQAQNNIARLEVQKATLLESLEDAQIEFRATKDGVIAKEMIENGQLLTAGSPMFELINNEKLLVKAEVTPYYATQIKEGLKVEVRYKGSETIEIPGVVSMVSPVAEFKTGSQGNQSTAIPIEVTMNGDMEGLKPGLLVDLKIITEDVSDVIAVPLLATMEDDEGEYYVFVVKDDFTLEKRYVEQGASNNQWIEISGIDVGELVVTNPTEYLEDGMSVNYMEEKEAEGEDK